MSSTREKLFGINHLIREELPTNKVSVIGVGQVGMACAFSCLVQQVCNELALSDINEDKLMGELADLKQGMTFLRHIKISADTNLKVTANSKIIIITAGARQNPGESRLGLVQRNVKIYKSMIAELIKYSPDAILLVVSNPVDIMTYVTWKLSGLPSNRVIGTGTNLDSARFRTFIGQKLEISATSCHAWIIGEHGDSSVPVWSGVNVGGVNLIELNPKLGQPDDPEDWNQIHGQVIKSAYDIIRLKGYTSWAIGLSVSSICSSILKDERRVYALSTLISKWADAPQLGIDGEVFFSVPCVIGSNGILASVSQNLNEIEMGKLKESAMALLKVQNDIQF